MVQIISDESLICRNDYSCIIGGVVLQIKLDGDKSNLITISFQLKMKLNFIQLKKQGQPFIVVPASALR